MPRTPHRIRRQSWRIRAASPADAFRLRAELREAWEGSLLPALEHAFDEAAGDDRVVRIPRLELRLRLDSPDRLAEELPRLIREAVAHQLRAPRAESGPRESFVSERESRAETLLHYLRTGSLPWHAAGRSHDEVRAELEAACAAELPALLRSLAAEPSPGPFAFRLLQLLDGSRASKLVSLLPPATRPSSREALAFLLGSDEAWRGSPPPRHQRLELATELISEILARPDGDSLATLAASAGAGPAGARDIVPRLQSLLPPSGRTAGGTAPRAEARPGRSLPGPGVNEADAPIPAAEPIAGPRSAPAAGHDPPRSSASQAPVAGAAARDAPGVVPEEEPGFGSSVCSAGLILLHPFLPRLLAHLGLSEEGAIAVRTLPRSAALLHYIATGREEPLDFELALVKLLLGVAPEAPLLLAEGLLDAADREEADALLRAAIGHWSVLKTTSPDGLRSAFLQRTGLLRRMEGSWELRVEPAPFDLLLPHLPWSISIVAMPWMPEPLYVEWPTP